MDDFELALDDCLRRLAAGTSSLGQCLGRYPQYAAELRPLLETALQFQQGREIKASGALRDRTRNELTDFIQSHPRSRRKPRKRRTLPGLAITLLFIALFALLFSTAFAQHALSGPLLHLW